MDAYRSRKVAEGLSNKILAAAERPMRFMEVCGTHTMSIFRHGIRSLLPSLIHLVSGPGCPVCVTSAEDIDHMMDLALLPEVTVATFGDLVRVPGSHGSLAEARAEGAQVKVVYSPTDALETARKHPETTVCFLGIGFETTTPAVAATILQAWHGNTENFCVYSTHKLMPPALDVLMSDPLLNIDGLLCPGHVSSITGARAYEPLALKYNLPCVVAGFEPADILRGIYMLVRQVSEGKCRVENAYERAVSWEGNSRARQVVQEVFEPVETRWRGLGTIMESGLGIRRKFGDFDARVRFNLEKRRAREPLGCLCHEIIKGKAVPSSCPLFSIRCTPVHPVGPCMVSSEGTCAAYYKYGGS